MQIRPNVYAMRPLRVRPAIGDERGSVGTGADERIRQERPTSIGFCSGDEPAALVWRRFDEPQEARNWRVAGNSASYGSETFNEVGAVIAEVGGDTWKGARRVARRGSRFRVGVDFRLARSTQR